MTKVDLAIASPGSDFRKIEYILKSGRVKRWLYLGNDYFTRLSIENKLRNGYTPVDIAKIHKDTADEIKFGYVDWIDALNRKYGKDLEWWFGSVFSRHSYDSNLFQSACYLEVLERLLSGGLDFPDVIFVESFGLARAVKKWAAERNVSVKIFCRFSCITRILWRLRTSLNCCNLAVSLFSSCIAAFVSRVNRRNKQFSFERTAIIHTYVHNNSLSEEGVFTDSYFSSLYGYLAKKNFSVIVHPVFYGFKCNHLLLYNKIRKSPTPFIIKEDFLRPYDYLVAFTYPIRNMGKSIRVWKFRDFDLSDVVKEERSKEQFTSGIYAVLTYRLLMRLKEAGLKPSVLIQMYENQVIDKAVIAGARKYFPGMKLVGAQMFLHTPNFLNLYPSQSEAEAGLAPDILVETSAHQCDVARSFARSIPCKVGAAIRYAHVFKEYDGRHAELKDNEAVLVLLPAYLPESVELLETLKTIIGDIGPDTEILIKPHPDDDSDSIIKYFKKERRGLERFRFIYGELPKTLAKAAVVISTSSGSIVEAAAYGIPVIYFGSQTMINQNILKDVHMEIARECYTASKLKEAINEYLSASMEKREEYREMGRQIRDMFFTPVTDETLASFLDSEVK